MTSVSRQIEEPGIARLYMEPVPSRRGGPLYNAFSYPTKIDPEAIALFIASHTSPGDTVLDVFAGSGTTGLAARLCEAPSESLRQRAEALGLPVTWGPRRVVLYELSVVGALLAQTMCNPPNPADFESAARSVVDRVSSEFGWLYAAEDPEGGGGLLRHIIWTDIVTCPNCRTTSQFWDLAVSRDPLEILKEAECSSCGESIRLAAAERAIETVFDPLTGETGDQRSRRPAFVYGRTDSRTWKRAPVGGDLELIERIQATPISQSVPTQPIVWGDLFRSGYHQGIERIHHFYTRRNLIALGALWDEIEQQPQELRDALRLLVLSYNAPHSTLMTRVVVKKGMSDLVLTGAQSGVLYVSSLPVEKNVFEGVRRKTTTFMQAFETVFSGRSEIQVVNASSTTLDLPDESVDYVFTDPPFGGFIPYAEINQINEAWLGRVTDRSEEAIISPAQSKDVSDYGDLMKRVFADVSRVMKDDAAATVVFHSSKPDVWEALGDALRSSDLSVSRTSLLDKTQVSFKQVVSAGGTRGDAVFLLRKRVDDERDASSSTLEAVVAELRSEHGAGLTPRHLYTRYVASCVEKGSDVEWSSSAFYSAVRDLDRSTL